MSLLRTVKNKLLPKPYFLVLGAGRGGTSLLASMLDYNSELEVGMERFAFDYLLGKELNPDEATQLDKRLHFFKEACRKQGNSSSKYWGNKITTEQIMALEDCENVQWPGYMQLFLDRVVADRKLIFITRDGRSCVNSKMKRTGQDYDTALQRWKKSVQMLGFLEANHPKLCVLRYEDLIGDPEGELGRVCEFLDVAYDNNMLNGPSNPKMPEMYKGQGLSKALSVKDWPASWTEDMKQELEKLGYLNEDSK